MLYYALKIAISAFIIVAIAELAKRSSTLAALLAALPLTSLLAFIWMHVEGRGQLGLPNYPVKFSG